MKKEKPVFQMSLVTLVLRTLAPLLCLMRGFELFMTKNIKNKIKKVKLVYDYCIHVLYGLFLYTPSPL